MCLLPEKPVPRNYLYCVGQDARKPYSLTHLLKTDACDVMMDVCRWHGNR